MRTYIALLLLGTAVSGYEVFRAEWDEWKAIHGKSYTFEEEPKRHYIWEQNLRKVMEHNLERANGFHSCELGMNQFADMDEGEWASLRSRLSAQKRHGACNSTYAMQEMGDLPDAVDWRKRGAVGPVQDQGSSGKSWTYSATGSFEGQNFVKTAHFVKLSEQNLADCATPEFSPYCEAGGVDCAFYYVMKNDGIDTEEGYPAHQDGKCHYTVEARGATCSGYVDLPSGDEVSLQAAVGTVGPISATINAGLSSFQLYQSGIYYDPKCSSTELDHAVLVVGYGTENGEEYWIVRNSWGASWGENGYIRMARNRGNNCGIATRASYPLM